MVDLDKNPVSKSVAVTAADYARVAEQSKHMLDEMSLSSKLHGTRLRDLDEIGSLVRKGLLTSQDKLLAAIEAARQAEEDAFRTLGKNARCDHVIQYERGERSDPHAKRINIVKCTKCGLTSRTWLS